MPPLPPPTSSAPAPAVTGRHPTSSTRLASLFNLVAGVHLWRRQLGRKERTSCCLIQSREGTAGLTPALGEGDEHAAVVYLLQGDSDTKRDQGFRKRQRIFTSICSLTLHAMEMSPAVNEDHCFPSFVVLWNTWIFRQVPVGQSGCV